MTPVSILKEKRVARQAGSNTNQDIQHTDVNNAIGSTLIGTHGSVLQHGTQHMLVQGYNSGIDASGQLRHPLISQNVPQDNIAWPSAVPVANLPTTGQIASSQIITDQAGLQLTSAEFGNTVAAQHVGAGLHNLVVKPNMSSGQEVHLQIPLNITPGINTTGTTLQQGIGAVAILQQNIGSTVNIPTGTSQLVQTAQTIGATTGSRFAYSQVPGALTSTTQAGSNLSPGQAFNTSSQRVGALTRLPTRAAYSNSTFQGTNPVVGSKPAQMSSWHTATLQSAKQQNRSVTTLTSSQSNMHQLSSQNITSSSPAIGPRTSYRIKAHPEQNLKLASRMPNPLALANTNAANVVVMKRTQTQPLVNVSVQGLGTNSRIQQSTANQLVTQRASPTFNSITMQRNQQTQSPVGSINPQHLQQHVEMSSIQQHNAPNQHDVQRANFTINAPQKITANQLVTQRDSPTCNTITKQRSQQIPSPVTSLNPQHSQKHVEVRSILQHNIPSQPLVQRSNISSNAPRMQGSPRVVRGADGRNYLMVTRKIRNDDNIQGAKSNPVVSQPSNSRPQTGHGEVTPQNNLCDNDKVLGQTQSENQSDKVIRTLLQTSSPATSSVKTGQTPSTASSTLYANPFLTSKVPAVQKIKYQDHSVNQKPTAKDDDESCYRIESEDEGYTIFIDQKDKNEKSNHQPSKGNKSAETPESDTTLSVTDFDLETDLSRLEDINKELNQLMSSEQTPEQSKELELIQQEQGTGEETAESNTFDQFADKMSVCKETVEMEKESKEMQILTSEEQVEPSALLTTEKKFKETIKNVRQSKEMELIAMQQKKDELERRKSLREILQQPEIHKKKTDSLEKVEQNKNWKGQIKHTTSVGSKAESSQLKATFSTQEVKQSISEQENKWRKAFGLPTVDKIKKKNPESKGLPAEKEKKMPHQDISKWWEVNDTPKNIVKRVLFQRITNYLAPRHPFRTLKLENPVDLLNNSEILALKNITKALRIIVESFEQEVTTNGMEYGEEIYFETLKLTTDMKSNIIPQLVKIQKEENGLWTQVLLVMLKDKLSSVNPSLGDQLCDTQDSLNALLPLPGVAQAVEDTLANFESKYIDTAFSSESYRRASCLLVYRIRKMIAKYLYWFETPNIVDCDFQLQYSLRKLIFLYISEFVGKLAPGLKHVARDIHAVQKLSTTRKDLYRMIDFCLGKFSQGKTGVFFETIRNVLLDIRRVVLGVFCIDQSPAVQYTFQNYGLVKEVESNLKPENVYPGFLALMNNLLSNLRVSQGQSKELKSSLFDERDFVVPRLSGPIPAVINATIDQTLNTVKRAKRPSIIPAQRFKGKTVHSSVNRKLEGPVWTAAFEETVTNSTGLPAFQSKDQKTEGTIEVPNRAVSHKIRKKKSAVGMVLDESNLSLYRSVSKEMKTGLRKSKTDILELIRENKLLMFSGLIETFLRKPADWTPSDSESDGDEIVNEETIEREPITDDTGCGPEGKTNSEVARDEAGGVADAGVVRIKQEPADSGVYGISSVLPTGFEEIDREIKVEPGLEKTIKKEKDSDWSNSDLVTNVKTEPVEPDQPSTEHCQQCPVYSGSTDDEPHEPSSELLRSSEEATASVNPEIQTGTSGDTCDEEKQPFQSELRSEPSKCSLNMPLLNDQITNKSMVETDGAESQTSREGLNAEPLKTPNGNLDDILSKTVDQIFATIHGEGSRKESSSASDNGDRRKADPSREEEHEVDTADITPLRHSVECSRQEALQFLKELNTLQDVEHAVSSENKVDECNRGECANTEETGKRKTSIVSTVKVRKSVELDKILSETVNRIYSEIQSDTSSVTETMEVDSSATKETEKVTDEAVQLDSGNNVVHRNSSEGPSADGISTPGDHALNHKAAGDKETEMGSTVKDNSDVQPTLMSTEPPVSDECINTNSDVLPIIIEPEGECEDIERKNMSPAHNTVEANAIKTEDVESDVHAKADTACEFVANNQQEVTTINIEPIDCETYQEPETTEQVENSTSENLDIKKEPVDQNPTTVMNSRSGTNGNEDADLDNAGKEPTPIIGEVSIGSCAVEEGAENRILSSLLKSEAKRQKYKRKAEKRREKIEELRKYYEEQIRIIREARLDIYTDRGEILEQLGYLKENRKLAMELGVDSAEIFGCYVCGFTAATQEEIMQHWMKVHLEDYLYVCPFCDLDLETSSAVVAHIMEWHPKRPVRVCLKPSEVYQDRIELEFGINNIPRSSDQCFIVNTRKECFSTDNIENEGRKYECNECEYFCTDLVLMQKHVKLAHTPGVRFECPQCKLYYRSFRAVQFHMLKDHFGRKNDDAKSLVSHLTNAEAIVPLDKLNWERINLETRSSLEYAARYSDVMHQCLNVSEKTCWDVCTTDFDSLFLMCKMCSHTHTEPEMMWKHVRETHGLPKFLDCPKCQNTIEVTPHERYSCLTFCRGCRLLLTLKVEQGKEILRIDSMYVCRRCAFRSGDINVIQQHAMQMHFQLKPYRCKYCGMANAVKHIVKRHITEIHPGQPSKVITDVQQIAQITNELECLYKCYQLVVYKDVTSSVCENKGGSISRRRRNRKLQDISNVDADDDVEEFDKGEDLSAVLAGFFGKPVKESMISQLFGQRRESSTSQLPRTKETQERVVPSTPLDTKNLPIKDQYKCKLCNYVCATRVSVNRHVKRHIEIYPYKCFYCDFEYGERDKVMKHTKQNHPDKENLVYTDQSVLAALNREAEKYFIKVKGPGTKKSQTVKKNSPFSHLMSSLFQQQKGDKQGQSSGQRKQKTSGIKTDTVLKSLVDKLPIREKPTQGGPSWEQKSSDDDDWWELNKDLESSSDESYRVKASSGGIASQMRSGLMLKLKRSGASNQWESARRPKSLKRQKRSEGTSQKKRKRYQVIDDADSDDNWSIDGRRRKRSKRREKKKRTFRRIRVEASSSSDWILSDSESDTTRRKSKVKAVEYKLSDEDYRTNYAFLLNDDKLLEDPVVKLVPVEMNGPVYIVKDQQTPKIKVEPQDIQDDTQMPFVDGVDVSLGSLVKPEIDAEMWGSYIKDQSRHLETVFGEERTAVELFADGERTIEHPELFHNQARHPENVFGEERTTVELFADVRRTIEHPETFPLFSHLNLVSAGNVEMSPSNETAEREEVQLKVQQVQLKGISQLKDMLMDAKTCSSIPTNVSSKTVNHTEVSHSIVEGNNILSEVRAHSIQKSMKREAGKCEGISHTTTKDESSMKQNKVRDSTMNNTNETIEWKETSQTTKKGESISSEVKTRRNIWNILSDPIQPTEMDETDAKMENIPGEIKARSIEASVVNKTVETEQKQSTTSGATASVAKNDQNLVKMQWTLDPVSGKFVEGNAAEDDLLRRDEIKHEPVLEKENVQETDLYTAESVLDDRRIRWKIMEGTTTKPQPSTIDESAQKLVISSSVKAGTSNRRHKWTDEELRIYHSHLTSDRLLVKKPIVVLEELDIVDVVYEDE